MSRETVVTTTSSTAASPSTVIPIGMRRSFEIGAHSAPTWYGPAPPTTRARMPMETTQPAPTARIPTGAPLPGRRLPTSRMTAQATRVRAGTSQASLSIVLLQGRVRIAPRPGRGAIGSPAQQVDLVDVHGLPVAEDQQDDREPDADLGGCHRDHEQREDLPGVELVLEVGVERDQVDVHRVQHQLDA